MNEQQPLSLDGEPRIEGVTSGMINNLNDIVRSWGLVEPHRQMVWFRSGDIGLGYELIIRQPLDTGDQRKMIVQKRAIPKVSIEIISLKDGAIFWEEDFSPEEAQRAINVVDEKAKEKGLIDELGKRKKLSPDESLRRFKENPRYSVEETFRGTKGVQSIPVNEGDDPSDYMKEFDQLERLTVLNTGDRRYIVLKDNNVAGV